MLLSRLSHRKLCCLQDFAGEDDEKILKCLPGNTTKLPEDLPAAATACWALPAQELVSGEADLNRSWSLEKPVSMSQMLE